MHMSRVKRSASGNRIANEIGAAQTVPINFCPTDLTEGSCSDFETHADRAASQFLHRFAVFSLAMLAAIILVLQPVGYANAQSFSVSCPLATLVTYAESIIVDPVNQTCEHSTLSVDNASGEKLFLGLGSPFDWISSIFRSLE